jgi:chromate transporter
MGARRDRGNAQLAGQACEGFDMTAQSPSLAEATRVWLRVGCLSFGGAAAQIAMLHRAVVEEKKWVEERRFLDALNYCTLLPGPEAQQLATYLGFILHGVRGGVIAGLMFVIPGALVMLALSALYVLGRDATLLQGLFFGIKAAVIAIVIEALLKIARRALKTPILRIAALLSFLALVVLDWPFPVVIIASALTGALLARIAPERLALKDAALIDTGKPVDAGAAFRAAASWTAVWWLPVAAAALLLGPQHLLVDVGLFFSKLAVITFGGAYAVLAYLADAAVNAKGWVTETEMIDGLGLAETTPGPTILVNQFAAFLAGWRSPQPFSPFVMAALASMMAVWVTFAPSFVWIFAGAPFVERVRANRLLQGALAMITAAVTGVIASLLLNFGLKVLFGGVREVVFGPLHVPWPDWAGFSPLAAALTGVAAFLLFRLHRGVIETVAVMAALGAAVTYGRVALGV